MRVDPSHEKAVKELVGAANRLRICVKLQFSLESHVMRTAIARVEQLTFQVTDDFERVAENERIAKTDLFVKYPYLADL